MAIFIWAFGTMMSVQVRVNSSMHRVMCIKAVGRMMNAKGKVSICGPTVHITQASGKKTCVMEQA